MVSYHEVDANGRPDEQHINDVNAGIGLQSIKNGAGNISILQPGEHLSQFNTSNELQVSKIVPEHFDDKVLLTSWQIDGRWHDLNLTSVTSYMDRSFLNQLDDNYRTRDWINVANDVWFDQGVGLINVGADLDIPVTGLFSNDTAQHRLSQELRVSSDDDGAFNFLLGLYYEYDRRNFDQDAPLPGLDEWVSAIAGPAFFDSSDPFIYGQLQADNWFEGRYRFNTEQYAVFGELSYRFDDFEIIAGGRFYDYQQDASILFAGFIEFAVGGDLLEETIKENGFSPKVEVLYKPNNNWTWYASAAEGFRLGSVQQFINPFACGNDLAALVPGIISSCKSARYLNDTKSGNFYRPN